MIHLQFAIFPANGLSSLQYSMSVASFLFVGAFPPSHPLPLGIVVVTSFVILGFLFCFRTVLTKSDNMPLLSATAIM